MLDAGEIAVTAAIEMGLRPRDIAERVWHAMRVIKNPVGRPQREAAREAALRDLRAGVSFAQVKRTHKLGGSLAASIKRQFAGEIET